METALQQSLLNLRSLVFRIATETSQPLADTMQLPHWQLRAWWGYFYRTDKAIKAASKKAHGRR